MTPAMTPATRRPVTPAIMQYLQARPQLHSATVQSQPRSGAFAEWFQCSEMINVENRRHGFGRFAF